jgi:hypothetical protein
MPEERNTARIGEDWQWLATARRLQEYLWERARNGLTLSKKRGHAKVLRKAEAFVLARSPIDGAALSRVWQRRLHTGFTYDTAWLGAALERLKREVQARMQASQSTAARQWREKLADSVESRTGLIFKMIKERPRMTEVSLKHKVAGTKDAYGLLVGRGSSHTC